jgi:hypothetical protein
MRRMSRVMMLGAAANLIGCIVPRPLTTRTEVIAAADATPVFGDQAKMRVFDKDLVLGWDKVSRAYVPRTPEAAYTLRTLRVARLKGDVYLIQAGIDEKDYFLLPVRVSRTREVTPLACEAPEAWAAEFGVRVTADDYKLELRGDRAGIIGLMASALATCTPLFQVDTFVAPGPELTSVAAALGQDVPGCAPCPAGVGGCVQGSVTDESGAELPGVTVRLEPRSSTAVAKVAPTNDAGGFFITSIPEGSYTLRLQLWGFAALETAEPFLVKRGLTSLFEAPFELRVTAVELAIVIEQSPVRCGSQGVRRREEKRR